MYTMKRNRIVMGLSVLLILTLLVPASVLAQRGIIPIQASPFGSTYGTWAARWWNWAAGIEAATSPVTDTTGEFCAEGQSGKVWFLAGTTGGTVTRDCDIPVGKGVFFPIISLVAFDCGTELKCREEANNAIDGVNLLEVTIDGTTVNDPWQYRTESPAFEYVRVLDNPFGPPYGSFFPAVAAGYYLMLAPLSRGEHTIEFVGGVEGVFETGATYNLNVTRRR